MRYGFIRVACVSPVFNIADPVRNGDLYGEIIDGIPESVSIVLFPELAITGYTCQDLFNNSALITGALEGIKRVAVKSQNRVVIVGAPFLYQSKLYNCAFVISEGKVIGIVPKSYLPGYKEFYEPRWFDEYHSDNRIVTFDGYDVVFGNKVVFFDKKEPLVTIGIEICEDLWTSIPPSSYLSKNGALILCNLSASNIVTGKYKYRRDLVVSQSARTISAYMYASSGICESTKDLVFDGHTIISENGSIISEGKRFSKNTEIVFGDIDLERLSNERSLINSFRSQTDYQRIGFSLNYSNIDIDRIISPFPFVPPKGVGLSERCEEIISIQKSGLYTRLKSSGFGKSIIGISGGLDSTLALLVAHKTYLDEGLSPELIIAVTMPGFGTSSRTKMNALLLARELGVTLYEKPINELSTSIFQSIEHNVNDHSVVYENVQARARTLLLFSIANQNNGLVIGTGDLSESALGWCTYNGDHISSYNVNCSIPKTLVRCLIEHLSINDYEVAVQGILNDILQQPISPELIPPENGKIVQETEKIIGPYELHDFFLYYFVRCGFNGDKIVYLAEKAFKNRYSLSEIKRVFSIFMKRFLTNQWKRDCIPGGPKVGSVDLSPRGSWRMPSEININSNFIDF